MYMQLSYLTLSVLFCDVPTRVGGTEPSSLVTKVGGNEVPDFEGAEWKLKAV